jgi:putative transcriptional regulator
MIRIHLSRLLGEHKQRIADVQRETGLARNTLAGLYREDVARIDLATLDALCKHFGCKVSDLLEFVPEESSASKR